jgi:hypothetical protein
VGRFRRLRQSTTRKLSSFSSRIWTGWADRPRPAPVRHSALNRLVHSSNAASAPAAVSGTKPDLVDDELFDAGKVHLRDRRSAPLDNIIPRAPRRFPDPTCRPLGRAPSLAVLAHGWVAARKKLAVMIGVCRTNPSTAALDLILSKRAVPSTRLEAEPNICSIGHNSDD